MSEITISRFLRRLGSRGMTDLRAESGSSAASLPVHPTHRDIRVPEGELGALLRRNADAVLALGAQIQRPEWDAAIALLDRTAEVFVTGFQTVRGLGEDFARRPGIAHGAVRFLSTHDGGLMKRVPSRQRSVRRVWGKRW